MSEQRAIAVAIDAKGSENALALSFQDKTAADAMPNKPYVAPGPTRADLDAMTEPVVVEFGTNWCGICAAAQPSIGAAFTHHPDVAHVKIEDGSGRATGRSFGIKLWPTLIFMRGGKEVDRLVRPGNPSTIERALASLAA